MRTKNTYGIAGIAELKLTRGDFLRLEPGTVSRLLFKIMDTRRIAQIMLTAWLVFFIGLAIGDVGDQPSCEPFSSELPFAVLIFFGGSALLGYLSGAELKK